MEDQNESKPLNTEINAVDTSQEEEIIDLVDVVHESPVEDKLEDEDKEIEFEEFVYEDEKTELETSDDDLTLELDLDDSLTEIDDLELEDKSKIEMPDQIEELQLQTESKQLDLDEIIENFQEEPVSENTLSSVSDSESVSILPEHVEEALERVIEKMFAEKINNILNEVIEKIVSKKLESLKKTLIDDE